MRLRYLLSYLAAKGHHVHLFSHEYPGSRINGISHHEIPVNTKLSCSPKHFISTSRKIFRENSIELSNSIFFAFDLHNAYLLNKIARTNLRVVFVRGLPKYHSTMNNLTSAERSFIEHASKRGMSVTDRYIFNSYASAEDFTAYYGGARNFKILYNNVPTLATYPIERGKVDTPIMIGFIGQFITRKNPLFIMESLRNQFEKLNLRLLYKGRGELFNELKKYVVDNQLMEYVIFEDWGDNVEHFYRKIDVLIVPSLYDECPNVILEAIAHNVAVLGARTGGISELLNFNEQLLFSITDDGTELRNKISDITSSSEELFYVKSLCRVYAESYDFDWGAKALEAILS